MVITTVYCYLIIIIILLKSRLFKGLLHSNMLLHWLGHIIQGRQVPQVKTQISTS